MNYSIVIFEIDSSFVLIYFCLFYKHPFKLVDVGMTLLKKSSTKKSIKSSRDGIFENGFRFKALASLTSSV